MLKHNDISDVLLRTYIRGKYICWGGHKKLKIYGTLGCGSGKRMHRKNRVFFTSEEEARNSGYRPCGHCMPKAYRAWKLSVKKCS
ncbi:metal-binding protein [Sinomicrobium kalidii]|uniref:Ada metal-binding domain-containing protein n=1 Tax=Sinomicrobium kalidii TaxID=2900738 RepID=UPI001E3F1A11|nr:Ada metal-binding domain-containing protein [Sinomicrobium kalidii]UGU16300.1 metal-binding protein [Sinomicrobium kalidii]